jgi:hypothetical protein
MKNSNLFGIIIGSAIIIAGISAGTYFAVHNGGLRYITYGTLSDSEPLPQGISEYNVIVELDYDTASVTVIADIMTEDNIIEIDNTVTGPKNKEDEYPDQTDYLTITDDDDGNYTINFIEVDPTRLIYPFAHEVEIRVDYRAKLIVDMELTTGSAEVSLEQPNKELELVSMVATTGNIELTLASNTLVTGDFYFEATTGSISLGVGDDSTLDIDLFSVICTTGSVYIDMVNVNFTSDIDVNVDITTGNFNLDWTQESILTNHEFYIQGTTGDISINLTFDEDIGTTYTTSVTTGSTSVPSDSTGQAGMGQIDFYLDVTTGSILAVRH